MHHYLMFESEFDRLKDYFLLESNDGGKSDNYDDLEEGSNEDTAEADEKDMPVKSDNPGDGDDKPSEDGEKSGEDDSELTGDDSELDSGIDDILGEDSKPSPEEVNRQPAQPGAVDPKRLLSEMANGKDNIYTRVITAAKEKYPNNQCPNKDLLRIVSVAVKSFMKNKNYAISKDAFKAVCLNVTKTIVDKCKASKAPAQQQKQKPAQESVRYSIKPPVYETADWMTQWNRMAPALEESKLGNLAAAGTLAFIGAANAATAPSAPESTLIGTPRYTANVVQQDGGNVRQQKAAGAQQKGRAVAATPSTGNPSSVHFSPDSTYQMSPDDYAKFKQANNLPPHYTVNGNSDHQPVDTGKASAQSGGKPSSTQAAVKKQVKSGKTTQDIATGGEQCKVSPDDQKGSADLGKTVHELGHKAVDTAYKGGSALLRGAVDGAKGLWGGLKKGWSDAGKDIEKDHDEMIANRGK